MSEYLSKAALLLELLNEYIGRATAWLTAIMVIVTFAVVMLRYVFDLGWIAMHAPGAVRSSEILEEYWRRCASCRRHVWAGRCVSNTCEACF